MLNLKCTEIAQFPQDPRNAEHDKRTFRHLIERNAFIL